MSNVLSYQAEIENMFIAFLDKQGVSAKTISNYCSDVRHFIAWAIANNASSFAGNITGAAFFSKITPELLSLYRDQQITTGVPTASVNRRLSSVRMLFKSATDAGMSLTDPTQTLRNYSAASASPTQTDDSLLGAFEQSLRNNGTADRTVKDYVSDVREFLAWRQQQNGFADS